MNSALMDDFEMELLGLLELHPLNEKEITNLARANNKEDKLNEMLEDKIIKRIEFNGSTYLVTQQAI